ncbi:hypothetical protein IKD98_00315 [Candidatus Saccharibacteria bacterium]|nr:hypothetical protein [Candidatus Saccharibacteria bacterium]
MDHTFNFWLGVVVISTIGTLAHFVYDWTNQNKIIGLFTAVNESTWEHIKIALTPTFLWALYDGFVYGMEPNYFLAKFASVLTLIILIPGLFYSYRSVAKKDVLIADIAIFFTSIILSQLVFYVLITLPTQPFIVNYLACFGLIVLFGCYMTLTLAPLKTFIFKDPITHKYGFRGHFRLLKKKSKK